MAKADEFQRLIDRLASDSPARSFTLAEIHDFLERCSARNLHRAVGSADLAGLDPWASNYLAAMVEYACGKRRIQVPDWPRDVPPLTTPWFASGLESLRLYLLTSSPPAFRRRNLFVDSTLGDRV